MAKKWTQLLMLVICSLALLISGCGGNDADKGGAAGGDKVLRVGAETTFPPFEFADEKGNYSGFDLDLIHAIAADLGYKVEFKSMGFDALIPALNSKQIDVIISAMSITDERKNVVLFSDPYYKSGVAIVTNKANQDIQGKADLEGKTIACQIGNTGSMLASEIPNAKVINFDGANQAFLQLKNGGADAVMIDLPVAQDYMKKDADKAFQIMGDVLEAEEYGIAVSKDNQELMKKINASLKKLKDNGEYQKIYEKWFGTQK